MHRNTYPSLYGLVDEGYDFVTEENKMTCELCSFKVGGKSDVTVYPKNIDAFVKLIKLLKKDNIKHTVIGNGSNIVFEDEGYKGVIVCTQKMNTVEFDEKFPQNIRAYCGVLLGSLCTAARNRALSGLEFAYGIPGTVGGAVFMNAGAYDGEIKNAVKSVCVYDAENDEIKTICSEECDFAYRHSRFQNSGEIILYADFALACGVESEIDLKMRDFMQRRKDKQPLNYPSAGSVFKRYPGYYTAKLIDEAGLKGKSVGGMQVSEKHSGFIVNVGGGTCKDLKELIEIIKTEIKNREHIDIECEIRFIK